VPLFRTRRVTRQNPCPICDRPNWCLVATNGTYAICQRTSSARTAKGNCGGWIHRLAGAAADPAEPILISPAKTIALATEEHRDLIYRRLQTATDLTATHQAALLARGFSEAEVCTRGYRSLLLQGRAGLAKTCRNGDSRALAGVPGFFVTGFGENVYWTLAGSPGLLIPCRSPGGKIRAYRVRPDNPGPNGGKYRWLSSGSKSGGTSSGAWCHIARPIRDELADASLWIVEGEIKADLASGHLGAVVLSVPGVTLWTRALADLEQLVAGRGKIIVALDADWRDKLPVREATWGLCQSCLAMGYEVSVAQWDPQWKGLDDLLVAGQWPELIPPTQFLAPSWPFKVSSRILAGVPMRDRGTAGQLVEMRQRLAKILADIDPSF
jgi:hypothetical protein